MDNLHYFILSATFYKIPLPGIFVSPTWSAFQGHVQPAISGCTLPSAPTVPAYMTACSCNHGQYYFLKDEKGKVTQTNHLHTFKFSLLHFLVMMRPSLYRRNRMQIEWQNTPFNMLVWPWISTACHFSFPFPSTVVAILIYSSKAQYKIKERHIFNHGRL